MIVYWLIELTCSGSVFLSLYAVCSLTVLILDRRRQYVLREYVLYLLKGTPPFKPTPTPTPTPSPQRKSKHILYD